MNGEVFTGGATTSQHVEAEDDDHFENTTFKLKRTRSMGLLDEYIQPGAEGAEKEESGDTQEEAPESEPEESGVGEPPQEIPVAETLDLVPHDDIHMVDEPTLLVDYFSHQWDMMDISKSWRYIISKRKDVANSARLENASWRTWAQRRCNLKTISPVELNWSKDNDVTWLYGPILKDSGDDDSWEHAPRSHVATSAVAGDISINNKAKHRQGPKPILKRRTVEASIISHSDLLKLELTTNKLYQRHRAKVLAQQEERRKQKHDHDKTPEFCDYDAISAKLNQQYRHMPDAPQASSQSNSLVNLQSLVRKNSASALSKQRKLTEEKEQHQPPSTQSTQSAGPVAETPQTSPPPAVAKKDRHIRFNDVVTQCIVVDVYSDDDDESYHSTPYYNYNNPNDYNYYARQPISEDEYEDEYEDDDEEGGFFLNIKSPTGPNVPALSSRSSDMSDDSESSLLTIRRLPSTTINFGSDDESSDDDNPYTSSLSHGRGNSSRGYDYYYDYNSVYTCDPQHAVYGRPVVCDVPENISLGSNIDHDKCESENEVSINGLRKDIDNWDMINTEQSVQNQPTQPMSAARTPFELSDSDSDSDSDNGLSIGTTRSSQALAQQVFGQQDPVVATPEPQPANVLNAHYSSTSLAKQPHSSNSLSSSFFTGSATPALTSSLSRSFLGASAVPKPKSSASLHDSFFTPVDQDESARLPNTQPKSAVLPPHTTSTNAFKGGFVFEDDSDDSDEEVAPRAVPPRNVTPSYASLSEVAGKSGIDKGSPSQRLVGSAKGLANSIFGSK